MQSRKVGWKGSVQVLSLTLGQNCNCRKH